MTEISKLDVPLNIMIISIVFVTTLEWVTWYDAIFPNKSEYNTVLYFNVKQSSILYTDVAELYILKKRKICPNKITNISYI